jgi:hypothetical protein
VDVGASALAVGSIQFPPDSGLFHARGSRGERRSEAGSRAPSRPKKANSPAGPRVEAPSSSRLTGILRSPSDSRNGTSGRGSAAFQPRLELQLASSFSKWPRHPISRDQKTCRPASESPRLLFVGRGRRRTSEWVELCEPVFSSSLSRWAGVR